MSCVLIYLMHFIEISAFYSKVQNVFILLWDFEIAFLTTFVLNVENLAWLWLVIRLFLWVECLRMSIVWLLVIELEPVTSKRDVAVPSAPRGEPNFIHYSVGISRTSPQSCSRKQYKETEGTVVGESNFARHPLPLYKVHLSVRRATSISHLRHY